MAKILAFLGEIDGGLAAIAISAAVYDTAHFKTWALVGVIAGAGGAILNAISRFYGGGDVVKVPDTLHGLPPQPPTAPSPPPVPPANA